MKLNKGSILKASVEYVKELKKDKEKLVLFEKKTENNGSQIPKDVDTDFRTYFLLTKQNAFCFKIFIRLYNTFNFFLNYTFLAT